MLNPLTLLKAYRRYGKYAEEAQGGIKIMEAGMNNSSWKTTASGVLVILLALGKMAFDYLSGHPVDPTTLILAVPTGIGLMKAKDSDKTGLPK